MPNITITPVYSVGNATGSETAYTQHDLTTDPVALAIAKGCRWQELLDNGTYPTVQALEKDAKQDTAYVAHTIRLTLLAPEIIETVMTDQCPPALTLKRLSSARSRIG